MPQVGFFELYPEARSILKAGAYLLAVDHDLTAHPPDNADGTIAVDGSDFTLRIISPRYAMPPEQILSTFPPASAVGDWRQRLPQIVFKRRTLPWERDPDTVPPRFTLNAQSSPPWLALVVLAEGEGQLSGDVATTECVTAGTPMPDAEDTDTDKGKYLEVRKSIVDAIFPTVADLSLLSHVRKVNLEDTELALGDDDGFLSVVVANRLPQPGPPVAPITADSKPTSLRYTAYLLNLEGQLHNLPDNEVSDPELTFALQMPELLMTELFLEPPDLPVDVIALHGIDRQLSFDKAIPAAGSDRVQRDGSHGVELAAQSYATGPPTFGTTTAADAYPIAKWLAGESLSTVAELGIHLLIDPLFRFPVLVSWEFVCSADGTFESLMNGLDSAMLGSVDEQLDVALQPDITETGHIALDHTTRRGEPAQSWYRGPLVPQPTERSPIPANTPMPLAHTGDQLRRVVPDGHEDVSLASAFEIGRLLALSRPSVVSSMIGWREELFGVSRVKQLGIHMLDELMVGFSGAAVSGKRKLEDLIANRIVDHYAPMGPTVLGPRVRPFTASRTPEVFEEMRAADVLVGLGLEPQAVKSATKAGGLSALSSFEPVPTESTSKPLSTDAVALDSLRTHLDAHIDRIASNAIVRTIPHGTARRARRDALDKMIDRAAKSADIEEEQ